MNETILYGFVAEEKKKKVFILNMWRWRRHLCGHRQSGSGVRPNAVKSS